MASAVNHHRRRQDQLFWPWRGPWLALWLLMVAVGSATRSAEAQSVFSLEKPASYQPTIGEPHPDFILPGIKDGKPIRLSDYRGKKVLLVHFASW